MGRFSGLPEGRVDTRNCRDASGISNSYFVTYSCKYVTTDILPQFGATAGEEELPASATAGAGGSAGLTGGELANQGVPRQGPRGGGQEHGPVQAASSPLSTNLKQNQEDHSHPGVLFPTDCHCENYSLSFIFPEHMMGFTCPKRQQLAEPRGQRSHPNRTERKGNRVHGGHCVVGRPPELCG